MEARGWDYTRNIGHWTDWYSLRVFIKLVFPVRKKKKRQEIAQGVAGRNLKHLKQLQTASAVEKSVYQEWGSTCTHKTHRTKALWEAAWGLWKLKNPGSSQGLALLISGWSVWRVIGWLIGQQLSCTLPWSGLELVKPVHRQGACWGETKAYWGLVVSCQVFVSSLENEEEVHQLSNLPPLVSRHGPSPYQSPLPGSLAPSLLLFSLRRLPSCCYHLVSSNCS